MAKKTTKRKAAPRRIKEHTTQAAHIPEMPRHAHTTPSSTQKTKMHGNKTLYAAIGLLAVITIIWLSIGNAQKQPSTTEDEQQTTPPTTEGSAASLNADAIKSEIFPHQGFKTKVIPGDVIPRLVQSGAIDLEKFKQLYSQRGGLTEEQLNLLTKPSKQPLTMTPENMQFIINILWPLGIANKNPILDETSNYQGAGNLASTGGWDLGTKDTMQYFNKIELIKLTPQQQALAEKIAKTSYRPCCNNPTSFPDCNHGAALLALIELGASQGMSEDELYKMALQANTLWFPQQYLMTATLYASEGRKYFENAKEIMGKDYSSSTGWSNNVYKPMQQKGLLPKAEGGGSCGV